MTENQFLAQIRELCKWHGLLSYHTHRSDRSDPGFPDLVIVGRNGVIYRELKTAVGKLSPMQAYWLETLRAAGEDADVWRPADVHRAQQELKALGRLGTKSPNEKVRKRRQPRARTTSV